MIIMLLTLAVLRPIQLDPLLGRSDPFEVVASPTPIRLFVQQNGVEVVLVMFPTKG